MSGIKIWAVNECEWMAGRSKEECIQLHAKIIGWDAGNAEGKEECIDDPFQLSDDDLQRLIFTDGNGDKRTFAAELKARVDAGQEFPQFFATTEH